MGAALAVATFGALVSGSFMTGMRVSMLSSEVLLLSSMAAFVMFRQRAREDGGSMRSLWRAQQSTSFDLGP